MNQLTDPRSWLQKLLGINPPGKVIKGVRKLRDRTAGEGMRVVLSRGRDAGDVLSVDASGDVGSFGIYFLIEI